MKQHQYYLMSDKKVYGDTPNDQSVEYTVTLTTDNFQCYTDIYDSAYRIMSDFQEMEEPPTPHHGVPIPDGNGGFCRADEQHQAHHRDADSNQHP